jgi:hypothetical protein
MVEQWDVIIASLLKVMMTMQNELEGIKKAHEYMPPDEYEGYDGSIIKRTPDDNEFDEDWQEEME